jgi:hypothetical protein
VTKVRNDNSCSEAATASFAKSPEGIGAWSIILDRVPVINGDSRKTEQNKIDDREQ